MAANMWMTVGIAVLVSGCGGGGGTIAPSGPSPSTAPPGTNIGSAGGTVTSADGAVRLVIPAGALAQSTAVGIQLATQGPLDPQVIPLSIYDVTPALTFALPAAITVRFDPSRAPSGADASELRASVLDGGVTWRPIAGGTVDAAAREATASVGATGTFGVYWPGPSGACTPREHRQFDFWLGSWDYVQSGAFPGTNDITSESGGCLIQEHFVDTSGTRGRSVSFWSPADEQWHQTYVDTRGGRLVLVGSFRDGRIVLHETPTSRYVWETLDERTVRYAGELSADGGATWRTGFDARYVRR